MILAIKHEFGQGAMVQYQRSPQGPIETGRVAGIHIWQSRHFRQEAYMLWYNVEPEDCIGFEHDEDIEILGECTTYQGYPRIIGRKEP